MVGIDEDPKLLYYFKKRHLEEETRISYINCFKNYYKEIGLTPTEAIVEADQEEDDGIRLKRRKIKDHLDDFEEYLEENFSENTLKQYMSIVRTFYKFNEIELPVTVRRSPNPTPETSLEDVPNIDHIKKAIDFADVKYKAIIMLLASTSMRQGDCRALTLKHFINALKKYVKLQLDDLRDIKHLRELIPENIGPLWWTIWMEKKKRYYTCFSTPESLEYILRYLEHHPPHDFNEDTYLFRNYQRRGYNTFKQNKDNDKIGTGFISRTTLNNYFRSINRRCKYSIRPNGYIFFNPHSLRSWFANQGADIENGIGEKNTRMLMGHRVRDSTGRSYIKPNYKKLYNLYYKNMDIFTIYNKVEVHDITDERTLALEKQVHSLQNDLKGVLSELDRRDGKLPPPR
jgi:integrase